MPSAGRADRSFAVRLVGIAAAALAVRIAYDAWVAPRSLGLDAIWYVLQAETVSSGHGYIDPAAFYGAGQSVATANFPPLWPLVLAGAHHLGVTSNFEMRVVGGLLGTVSVVLVGLIGRRVRGSTVGLVAASVAALSPMLIAADGSLMSDSLSITALLAAVLLAMAAAERPTPGWFAALGAVLAVGVLARSDVLLAAPFVLCATALSVRRIAAQPWTAIAGRIALCSAIILVALGGWGLRNRVELGEAMVLSSNSGNVLEGANCASTYGGRLLGAWDVRCLVKTRAPDTAEVDWASAGRSAGITYAMHHLDRLPVVAVARAARVWGLWNPMQAADDLEVPETRVRWWQLLGSGVWLVVGVTAVFGFVRLRRHAMVGVLVAMPLAVTFIAVTSLGNTRFRLPVDALAAVPTAVVLVRRSAGSAPAAIPAPPSA